MRGRVAPFDWARLGSLALIGGGMALPTIGQPSLFSMAGILTALVPIAIAWRAAARTALRPAVAWAGVSMLLGATVHLAGSLEGTTPGRPVAGHLAYLSTLAGLSASISVLNARRPGGGAWAILMGLLALVMLVPWLEGTGLARGNGAWGRLRLESPWTIFYILLVIAGITNYLPTRYGWPASVALIGLAAEYAGLCGRIESLGVRGRLWPLVPSCFAASAWLAQGIAARSRRADGDLDRLWLWFRDGWGVVWALRTMERFNKSAEAAGLAVRLGWDGASGDDRGGVELLRGLLRRFADKERIESGGQRTEDRFKAET